MMVTDKNNLLLAVGGFALFFLLTFVKEGNWFAAVASLVCWLICGLLYCSKED